MKKYIKSGKRGRISIETQHQLPPREESQETWEEINTNNEKYINELAD